MDAHSARDIASKEANRKDAALLMALSESGRPVEVLAQFMASYIDCSGMGWPDIWHEFGQVFDRVRELLDKPNLIWPELMPGPGGESYPVVLIVEEGELEQRRKSAQHLLNVIEILGKDETPFQIVEDVTIYLIENELISAPDMDALVHLTIVSTEIIDNGMLAVDRTGQLGLVAEPFYTNFTNPDGDEVMPGHNIGVRKTNWAPLDGSEVHELLN